MSDLLWRIPYRDHRKSAAGCPGLRGEAYAFTAAVPEGWDEREIELVTELGSGGALRLLCARDAPGCPAGGVHSAGRAVPRRCGHRAVLRAGLSVSLATWGWMPAGEPAPTGPTRRGAKPPVLPVAAIDDPALPKELAEPAAARADEMDADTVDRQLSIARKAIGW